MKITESIKENRHFRFLYAKGKTAAKKNMALYVRKNKDKSINRLGITVSAKIGNAVVRNRIRRRIKEAYRLSEDSLCAGFDIVIVARKAIVDATFAQIVKDMASLMQSLGVSRQNGEN